MNRELIIILICIFFVGFFYMGPTDNSNVQSANEITQPVLNENNVDDTTKTSMPNSLEN